MARRQSVVDLEDAVRDVVVVGPGRDAERRERLEVGQHLRVAAVGVDGPLEPVAGVEVDEEHRGGVVGLLDDVLVVVGVAEVAVLEQPAR